MILARLNFHICCDISDVWCTLLLLYHRISKFFAFTMRIYGLSSRIDGILLWFQVSYCFRSRIFSISFWNSIFHKCGEQGLSFSMALLRNIYSMSLVCWSWLWSHRVAILIGSWHPWWKVWLAESLLRFHDTWLWIVIRLDLLRIINDLFCMMVENLLILFLMILQ